MSLHETVTAHPSARDLAAVRQPVASHRPGTHRPGATSPVEHVHRGTAQRPARALAF
ncbi:hypothetical protein [Saccharothrix sp. ST-888]|uniref:hypothetical protein n=1 Tax=Saccharothrix sp. ST-888 TaxID=1427391 RepID=UPI000B2FC949|nr:hypothetical protein [Saccharothrix sp. ST-888]